MVWAVGRSMTFHQKTASPYLDRFCQKIADNAAGWLVFVRRQAKNVSALEQEFANLARAVSQALLEPRAYRAGLELAIALWPFVEQRGHWLAWQRVLDDVLAVCRRLNLPDLEAQLLDQLGELARALGNSQNGLAWQEQALRLYRQPSAQPPEHAVPGPG